MEGYGNENPGAFQPTRPLRGATEIAHKLTDTIKFQPTRPLRGATYLGVISASVDEIFQPTRPLRGATDLDFDCNGYLLDFNPRAPCGARLIICSYHRLLVAFQPTRPLRGATRLPFSPLVLTQISTHAPLAGRDSKSVQITMHIFAITDKFQMLLHRMPPVRAFCSFLMQENHADFGCEPPK